MRSLMTWSPRTLTNDAAFDGIFEDFFRVPSTTTRGWLPSADVVENGDHYLLSLDLPGFKREDLEVSVEDGTLTVRGTRHESERSEDARVVRSERYSGEFARSFRLGDALDTGGIDAHHENGVLTVRVPKAEEAKPRRIDVK